MRESLVGDFYAYCRFRRTILAGIRHQLEENTFVEIVISAELVFDIRVGQQLRGV